MTARLNRKFSSAGGGEVSRKVQLLRGRVHGKRELVCVKMVREDQRECFCKGN